MPAGEEKIFKGLRSNFGEHKMKGELELRDNKLTTFFFFKKESLFKIYLVF